MDKSLSCLRAKRKVHSVPVAEILYANDVCLMANSLDGLHYYYLDSLDEPFRKFDLVISASKTQYLGSLVRSDNRLESEISARIAKATEAFGDLSPWVWKSHDMKLYTKIAVCRAIILPLLLYALRPGVCTMETSDVLTFST